MTTIVTDHEQINMMQLILARQDNCTGKSMRADAKIKFIQDKLTAEFARNAYPILETVISELSNSNIVAAEFDNTRIEMLAANIKRGTGSILLYDTTRRENISVLFTEKKGPELAFCFTREDEQSPITCAATSCYGTMHELKAMIGDVARGLQGADNPRALFTVAAPAII